MGKLQEVYRRHVSFEPENPQHREAYWRLRSTGRQDAELRFVLEEGFADVLSMMRVKIADHFSRPVSNEMAKARVKAKVA